MRKLFTSLCLLGALSLPALAQPSQGYSTMLQTFAGNRYKMDALVLERFVTINASPEWWQVINAETFNGQETFTHEFSNVAGAITTIATNLGWDNVRDFDRNNGYDGSNPLLGGMLDQWKGKIAFTFDLNFKPDAKSIPQTITNIDYLLSPLTSTYTFKPRGGKAFVNVKVDPKVSKFSCKVSKDGNTYDILMPAYAGVSQGNDIEPALKRGL